MVNQGTGGRLLNNRTESGSASPDSSPQKDQQKQSAAKKDPNRPKRKKARRACAACQRAHLTCGDERPCERCIKRGLQDDCHDGARKKAKYLRDAPDEALQPGAGRFYSSQNGKTAISPPRTANSTHNSVKSGHMRTGSSFVDGTSQASNFSPMSSSTSGRPQMMDQFNTFPNQNTTMQPPQYGTSQQSSNQAYPSGMTSGTGSQDFMRSSVDASDPNIFGFDPSSLNFGNEYGALEFGMLGQMASGADSTMGHRSSTAYDASAMDPSAYISNDLSNYGYNQHRASGDWHQSDPRFNSWASQQMDPLSNGQLDANTYSIGNANGGMLGTSPGSNSTDFMAPFEVGSPDNTYNSALRKSSAFQYQSKQLSQLDAQSKQQQPLEHRPSKAVSKKLEQLPPAATTAQRRRNAAKIYQSVIEPYPYTARFHALIAVISRRFKSHKRLRIAKALGSIRPSFISCTRNLIQEDLILMEKNFQRSLLEYRDHVSACGTPTIICRRTGEVAYCGESFLLLSGWPHGVLLGKEPNLNINRGNEEDIPSGSLTASSRGGLTTPRNQTTTTGVDPEAAGPHPVFLTDLLNDDNVVQFYEDFAKIAFADSKGSRVRRCKLLKYKTKEDLLFASKKFEKNSPQDKRPGPLPNNGKQRSQQQQQQDISRLGEDDGTVDCMFCWTVKRDVFEFPMMIVINFLPILQT